MLIRPLEDADIPAVARLFRAAALEFIVHESPPEGAANFLRENDEEGLRGFVRQGHVYHVALADGELAGFVAVRELTHLFHLFVDKRWHGQGVARRLWEVARRAALDAGNPGFFTVNSSNHALPVYAAWGFVPTAERQFTKGLYYTPMRLEPVA
ncbi:GNAT family N-acetyltransferase [Massilia solisilvae]|uniref:GNAT family N-acetyltransferase n=1 Tax=Massilia solisilvae TaxID=1811225 RepID=A0ABT2BM73_9BURK|nr:GNAT family N-acetyltransferase [Massilia solisilvae]MCS0609612.1 GNAT family N-acetyltransferase [Massilia solisilvae]